MNFWRTSTRRPSISRTPTIRPAASRRFCRRAFRICWSTGPAASPSAWRPTFRRTISREVVDGCVALIDNPAIELPELMEIIPGPDFPTGGIVLGRLGIYNAYSTGRGSIVMRGKVHVEEIRNEREAIIVTEVPYQVNKATMIEKMAELVRDKRIEGISDIRDESDRQGYRVVIELKRDANADVVLNQLYRYTPLQTSFGANMVALNGGKPE
jgi:DNA gyrase subunit A